MNIPENLKYSSDHEWIRVEGEVAYVGITDFAQHELGDIVFVDITTEGETLEKGEVVLLPGKWERTMGSGDIYEA